MGWGCEGSIDGRFSAAESAFWCGVEPLFRVVNTNFRCHDGIRNTLSDLAQMNTERFPTAFGLMLFAIFLIAPLGVAAPMGLVPLLAVAGLCGFFLTGNKSVLKDAFPPRIIVPLGALAVLGIVSAVWAPAPTRAATLTLKLGALSLLGLVAWRTMAKLDAKRRGQVENIFLAGLVLSFVILLMAILYAEIVGDSLWGTHSGNPLTTLSRGEAVLALLTWPAGAILWRRWGWKAAAILFIAIVLCFILLTNAAVLLSLAAGAAAFASVLLLRRKALAAIGSFCAALALLAPAVVLAIPAGDVMFQKIGGVFPSVVHRVYTWHFVTDRILERPFIGWGLDASRNIPGGHDQLNLDLFAIWGSEILPLHPHNAALQVWLELGLPGALLMAGFILAVFLGPPHSPQPAPRSVFVDALRAAATTSYLAIGALSYGVWQNWWIAAGWLLAALIAGISEDAEDADETGAR